MAVMLNRNTEIHTISLAILILLSLELSPYALQLTGKLCGVDVAINYTPLSMAYYAYGSTANFLSLGSTVLICISKEQHCKEELRTWY